MQGEQPFTMMSPSSGFTTRVMARIEERERALARRRAVVGAGVLVAAAAALFALVGLWIATWISALLVSPGAVFSALVTVSPMLDDLLVAFWVAALAIWQNVNGVMLLVYAAVVLALTLVWAHVVTGPFQHPSALSLGGQ
jgi:hypothetical protein